MPGMDDQRFGMAVRSVRVRQRKRQADVARGARVSRATVSRIERGLAQTLSLETLRRVCATLEMRVELQVRTRGADLDRLMSARHSQLAESVIRTLRRDSPEWQVLPEVSFAIWGERGVIDILAWHPGRRALLVIEVKTEIVDVGEMVGTLDKKRRLGREIAARNGWDPATVSVWAILADGRTNERRIAEFRSTLRAAYPDDGRRMRGWLANPVEAVAAMSIWPATAPGASRQAPTRRVRRQAARTDSAKRPPGER
jgi:transcriptional regulator with XRE-family HTH domain